MRVVAIVLGKGAEGRADGKAEGWAVMGGLRPTWGAGGIPSRPREQKARRGTQRGTEDVKPPGRRVSVWGCGRGRGPGGITGPVGGWGDSWQTRWASGSLGQRGREGGAGCSGPRGADGRPPSGRHPPCGQPSLGHRVADGTQWALSEPQLAHPRPKCSGSCSTEPRRGLNSSLSCVRVYERACVRARTRPFAPCLPEPLEPAWGGDWDALTGQCPSSSW